MSLELKFRGRYGWLDSRNGPGDWQQRVSWVWVVERVDVYVNESSDGLESTHFSLVSFETFQVFSLFCFGRAGGLVSLLTRQKHRKNSQ